MPIKCPTCGGPAELLIASVIENDAFENKNNDWKLRCGCGMDAEGNFPAHHRAVLAVLFLLPIALFWGIYLSYADKVGSDWIRFFVWILHIALGMAISSWISIKYGILIIKKYIVTHGEFDSQDKEV